MAKSITMEPRRSAPPPANSNPPFIEWIRVSTQDQADRGTPEIQRVDLHALRRSRPGRLVAEIGHTGSGAADERADIRRLTELATEGAFDDGEVRVWRLDRITRHPDPRQRAAIFGIIADARAVIVEATGRVIDPRDEMGELDVTLQGWFAARERKRLRERTQAGKKRKAREGRLAQGQPPFGRTYDPPAGKWGIDETEAATLRRMFVLCLEGYSLTGIAAALNSEGRISPRGHAWTGSNVARLLRDPAAHGRYTTHGETICLEPILGEATFRAVDAKLRANNCLSGPKPTVFALLRQPLGACGACGAPLYTQKGSGPPVRRYYYCSAKNPACHLYHRVDDVDAKVIERLRAWLDDPNTLAEAAALDAPKDAREAAQRDLAVAEAELRKLDKQVERVTRVFRKGLISEHDGEKALREVAQERRDAEARLAAATERLSVAERQAAQTADLAVAVKELRRGLADATPEKWRELCDLVFPKGGIRVFPNGEIQLVGWVPVGPWRPNPSGPLGRR